MRWEQQGNPSSHWTTALSTRWYWVALCFLTLFHFALSTWFPPAEDELYYWTWAKTLSLSYYDHPPMVAYLIALSTKIFGDNLFGIRFFACLGSTFVLMALGQLSPNKQLLGLVLWTPIFFWGGILMTPDVPLVCCWTLYVVWLVRLNHSFAEWSGDPVTRVYHRSPVIHARWALGGLILGVGLLSKYTMALAIPCTFFVLISRYRWTAWASGLALHLLVALLLFSPVLFFNLEHDFASFRYQWAHAMSSNGFAAKYFWQFLASQFALIGALPLLMLPWVSLASPELHEEPKSGVLLYFYIIPFLFFLIQAARAPLEGNWALVAYVSFWAIAQRLLDHSSFKMAGKAMIALGFFPAIVVTVLFGVHLIKPLDMMPPYRDRLGKLFSQYTLAKKLTADLQGAYADVPLYTTSYQWTSYFKFTGWRARQLTGPTKPSHFTLRDADPCEEKSILTFSEPAAQFSKLDCFSKMESLGEYPLLVRGTLMGNYAVRRYYRE